MRAPLQPAEEAHEQSQSAIAAPAGVPLPHALTPAVVLALQRSAGNRAVSRMLARSGDDPAVVTFHPDPQGEQQAEVNEAEHAVHDPEEDLNAPAIHPEPSTPSSNRGRAMAKKLTAFVESIQESIPVAQRADLWLQTNAVGWTLAEAVSLIAEKAPTPGEAQYELKRQFPILKSTEIAVKRFQLVNAKVQAQSEAFAGTPLYREMMTTLWPYVLVMRKRPLFDTSTEGADRNGDEAERVAAFIKDFARRLGSDRQTRMLFATALSGDTMVKQHGGFGPWLEHSLSTGECAQLVLRKVEDIRTAVEALGTD